MSKQFEISDNEVCVWIEQESIHLKAVDAYGDPVELSKEEATKLVEALVNLIKEIDSKEC